MNTSSINGFLPACRYVDPEIFFQSMPAEYGNDGEFLRAKAVCQVCPAKEACLRSALVNGESDGVWGGLTPAERRWFKAQLHSLLALGEKDARMLLRTLANGEQIRQEQRLGAIVILLGRGWTEQQIAQFLAVSDRTVRTARMTAERIVAHCRSVGTPSPPWVHRALTRQNACRSATDSQTQVPMDGAAEEHSQAA